MELLHLPDAARQLGVSYPTLKQWIYKGKIRAVKTPGGHHRIPQPEIDRLLFQGGHRRAAGDKRALLACEHPGNHGRLLVPRGAHGSG